MCPCCSMIKQEDELKLCHPLDDISNLGKNVAIIFRTFYISVFPELKEPVDHFN
jgi:hypothetical protein